MAYSSPVMLISRKMTSDEVIVEICGHSLEVFMLVSEIFDNVDMGLGIKNIFELEGVIDSLESWFRFLSRYISIFPREQVVVKPGEKKLIPIEMPFIEEISGWQLSRLLIKDRECQ